MAKTKHPVQKAPTTTAMELVDANSGRTSIVIQNAGTVRVYLDRDNTVSAASSIYLDPADILEDDTTDAWWGKAASGTGDLRIVEVF